MHNPNWNIDGIELMNLPPELKVNSLIELMNVDFFKFFSIMTNNMNEKQVYKLILPLEEDLFGKAEYNVMDTSLLPAAKLMNTINQNKTLEQLKKDGKTIST